MAVHFDENTFLGTILVFVATIFNAFWTIDTQYLEDQGIKWLQMLVIAQLSTLFYSLLYWIVTYSYTYYVSADETNISFWDHLFSIFPPLLLNNASNDNDDSAYIAIESQSNNDNNNNKNNTSIINNSEKYNKRIWYQLIVRGIIITFDYQFYIIALMYLTSGDAMLIRATLTSIGQIILSVVFFHEKLNFIVFLSLIIAMISIILVCQPAWIFENDTSTVSSIGLLFLIISGLFRMTNKTFLRYTKQLNVHFLGVIITGSATCATLILLFFIILCIISQIDSNIISLSYIWYNLSNINDSNNCSLIYFLIYTFGIVEAGCGICNAKGYQIGELGRLGIIATADIAITYILQIVLLNESINYITGLGIVASTISVSILFYEQWRKNNQQQHAVHDQPIASPENENV